MSDTKDDKTFHETFPEKTFRRNYIDNIRWVTVLVVILYHVILTFNSVGIIKNIGVDGIPQMDAFLPFVYPWFMCLLFVVGGMSIRYSLEKRSGKAFAKERVKRLLVPSIAGIFLLGWIASLITNQYTDMFMGNGDKIPGFIKYFIFCLMGIGPLWFAHELFLGSMLILLLRTLDKQDRIWKFGGKANLIALLLFVLPVWGSSMILNTPFIEVYRNGIYLFMMLLGYFVFSHDEVTDILAGVKLPLLAAALVSGVAYVIRYYGENYAAQDCLQNFFTNWYAWIAILAAIGCFKAWGNKENAFTDYMRRSNFGFYVLHYPLMVILAYLECEYLSMPMFLRYVALLASELALLPPMYEMVRRLPVIGTLLLGKVDGSVRKTLG